MAKIINIHTGKEVTQELKVPDIECTICKTEFDLEEEGGTAGYFGMLPVTFCPFCFSSILDMAKFYLEGKGEEDE